jgi:hypothetical protein
MAGSFQQTTVDNHFSKKSFMRELDRDTALKQALTFASGPKIHAQIKEDIGHCDKSRMGA